MQPEAFTVADEHEVISITLGGLGRLAAIELKTSWRTHYQAEALAAQINAILAQARLEQLQTQGLAAVEVPADGGRLDEVVKNWQNYTAADAEAAEAEMWAALNELEKTLNSPAEPPETTRLSNGVHNVSMAWDGYMLADLAFANEQIAERPAGWLNESFAEIIAQTDPQEQTDGTE